MAHLYDKIDYPYPGNEEAMKEFIAKGGMIGMKIGPKGLIKKDDSQFPKGVTGQEVGARGYEAVGEDGE